MNEEVRKTLRETRKALRKTAEEETKYKESLMAAEASLEKAKEAQKAAEEAYAKWQGYLRPGAIDRFARHIPVEEAPTGPDTTENIQESIPSFEELKKYYAATGEIPPMLIDNHEGEVRQMNEEVVSKTRASLDALKYAVSRHEDIPGEEKYPVKPESLVNGGTWEPRDPVSIVDSVSGAIPAYCVQNPPEYPIVCQTCPVYDCPKNNSMIRIEKKPINMDEQQHPEKHERPFGDVDEVRIPSPIPGERMYIPAEAIPKQRFEGITHVPDEEVDPGAGEVPEPRSYLGIINEMVGIHERKNSDYGGAAHEGYKRYGDYYYLAILFNKLKRLESLTIGNTEQKVLDESIDDSLMDMANYAIMYLESRYRND